MVEFWQAHGWAWVVLPTLIFCARIVDVSISTLRFMFLARGARWPTVLIGFFEALVWIIIISQIIRNLDNVMGFIAYAAGFSAGTYVGIRIEERLAFGKIVMRVITQKPADALLDALKAKQYGVTNFPAEGAKGPVQIIFMVLRRAQLESVVELIKSHNPNAFYTIEDVRFASEGAHPLPPVQARPSAPKFGLWRRRAH